VDEQQTAETIRFDKDIYQAEGTYKFHIPERSEWKCYMFGNKPETNDGIVYIPKKGCEPNWFVRWMMKVCFGCTWVKEKNND
jgi:hypothetical protein